MTIEDVFNRLFVPPAPPPLDLPFLAKMSGQAKTAVGEAFKLAYFAGVKDGLLVGVILGFVGVFVLRALIHKGGPNVTL